MANNQKKFFWLAILFAILIHLIIFLFLIFHTSINDQTLDALLKHPEDREKFFQSMAQPNVYFSFSEPEEINIPVETLAEKFDVTNEIDKIKGDSDITSSPHGDPTSMHKVGTEGQETENDETLDEAHKENTRIEEPKSDEGKITIEDQPTTKAKDEPPKKKVIRRKKKYGVLSAQDFIAGFMSYRAQQFGSPTGSDDREETKRKYIAKQINQEFRQGLNSRYLADGIILASRINHNYVTTSMPINKTCVLAVRIGKGGKILNAKLLDSFGNQEIDTYCIQTTLELGEIPQFAAQTKEKEAEIQLKVQVAMPPGKHKMHFSYSMK